MPDDSDKKKSTTWWIEASSQGGRTAPASVPYPDSDPLEGEVRESGSPVQQGPPVPDDGCVPLSPDDPSVRRSDSELARNEQHGAPAPEPTPPESPCDREEPHAASPAQVVDAAKHGSATALAHSAVNEAGASAVDPCGPAVVQEPACREPLRTAEESGGGRGLIDLYLTLEPVISTPVNTVGLVIVTRCQNPVRRGQLFHLKQPKTLFGRGRNAGLRIEGNSVREDHAVITFEGRTVPPGFRLHPLGPVEVNGAVIDRPTVLRSGDRITIGDAEMTFFQVDLT